MYYLIYETRNKLNGKVYRGAHRTKDPADGYMGSGVALHRAMEKYGRENFETIILEFCETTDEMWERERELVEIGEHTYNLTLGGKGGFGHIDNSGDKNPMRNPEVAERMVASARANGSYHTEAKLNASLRNLQKATEANIGKERSNETKAKISSGNQKYWAENKERMRDCLASWFMLQSPDGVEYKTNRLEDFCKKQKLPYTTIWKISQNGKSPTRGKAKGWLCKKI